MCSSDLERGPKAVNESRAEARVAAPRRPERPNSSPLPQPHHGAMNCRTVLRVQGVQACASLKGDQNELGHISRKMDSRCGNDTRRGRLCSGDRPIDGHYNHRHRCQGCAGWDRENPSMRSILVAAVALFAVSGCAAASGQSTATTNTDVDTGGLAIIWDSLTPRGCATAEIGRAHV